MSIAANHTVLLLVHTLLMLLFVYLAYINDTIFPPSANAA